MLESYTKEIIVLKCPIFLNVVKIGRQNTLEGFFPDNSERNPWAKCIQILV